MAHIIMMPLLLAVVLLLIEKAMLFLSFIQISDVLSDGAQLIRVENGVEKVIGTYSEKFKNFIPEK